MASRWLALMCAILLASGAPSCAMPDGASPTLPTQPAASPPAGEAPGELRETELAIAEAVNDERRAEGLEPLESRDDLARVARDYSERMLEEDFFAHVAPEGDDVADRVREAGIIFSVVGENIYRGEGPVDHVEFSVRGWMQSPGHRENILRDVFTQAGVGMAREGDTAIVTQVFLTP